MIKVGSESGDLENRYYKNKSDLIDDLMNYGSCYLSFCSEEDEIAKSEGFKDIKDKLLHFKTFELISLFEAERG